MTVLFKIFIMCVMVLNHVSRRKSHPEQSKFLLFSLNLKARNKLQAPQVSNGDSVSALGCGLLLV